MQNRNLSQPHQPKLAPEIQPVPQADPLTAKLPRAKLIQRNCSDLSTPIVDSADTLDDCKLNALPTPPLSRITDRELSEAHSGPVDHADSFDALESSDYLKVEAALAKMDVETLLDQLDKPKKPK